MNALLQKEIRLDNGYYSAHEQELEEVLQSLNQTLKNAAVTITADEDTVLRITVNLDKFRIITQRKAGRKKKRTNILLEEMNEYRKTHTAMETAQWLGLTKQTFYRKLREHQKANHDGSVEF